MCFRQNYSPKILENSVFIATFAVAKQKLPNMKYLKFLITFILTSISVLASSFNFMHLDTSNGLPNLQVEAIAQDNDGYIWIGTRNGLAKYDGYNVQVYNHVKEQPHSLVHNFVHGLFVDSKGRLWIGTENGVCRYRPETDDFCCYRNISGYCTSFAESKDGRILTGTNKLFVYENKLDSFLVYPSINHGTIASMAQDAKGNIYVSTNRTVFSFNSTLTSITPLNSNIHYDIPGSNSAIIPLFVDSRQCLWVGCNDGGMVKMELSTGASIHFSPKELTGGIVRTIREDKQRRMWIGTENGVAVILPDGSISCMKKEYNNASSLSDNAIYSILPDKNDNIWIGSYFGGVDYLPNRKSPFIHHKPSMTEGYFKARIPRMMTESEPGVFWIATEDNGIHVYNANTGLFTPFTGIPQLGTNIHSIYYDKQRHNMWIGTRFNGLFRYNTATRDSERYYHSRGIPSEGIFYICQTRNGTLWVATMDGLRRYDPESNTFKLTGNRKLDNSFIYSLHLDRRDRLWAATTSDGLYCIEKGRTVHYCKENGSGLTDNYVITIFEDSRGTIWIGTNNNGLYRLDAKERKIKPATCGLPQQCTICSIVEDDTHHLWMGTDRGLYLYGPEESLRRFAAGAELPVSQFNFTSAYLASNGNILMGTFNGLIEFDPKKAVEKPVNVHVHFKKLYINGKLVVPAEAESPLRGNIDHTDRITLSYEEARSFNIEYGVVMPGNAENIQYQIFVDGIDRTWRNAGTGRNFYGYLIQPGTYTLHVRANTSDKNWDKCSERTLKIVVEAPFYRSTLAYIIYFLLLCGVAAGVLLFYNMRMKEQAEIRFVNMEKEKVKEVDKMKSDFFTMVSHELKTPLSLIVAPLKSISGKKVDKEVSNSLDLAIRNATKMERLINELVTFNKIETDNFPFYVQQGNPVEFIRMAADNFKEIAASKGLTLTIRDIDNGEEGWFSPSYLDHILNNLMSNAMKFTASGGSVTISAETTQMEGTKDLFLKLQVADTGIGIVKEEQQKIFGRYYQTKRGFNANSNGWGIGLALVSRLAEIHKGQVTVKSELGKGSTFTVTANISEHAFDNSHKIAPENEIVAAKDYLAAAEKNIVDFTADKVTDKPAQNGGSDGAHTILVVEDNAELLKFLHGLFAGDYNVITACDGQEAWDTAMSRQDIELVISDVMMPRMTGNELCSLMKGNMATSHIPVILLTAKSDPEDMKDSFRNGADIYIKKPFDPTALRLQTENILRLIRNRQESIAKGGDEAAGSNEMLTPLDKNFVHRISELVDKNIGNADFSVTDICTEMGISRSLLYTKMKCLMNISTGDYIRQKRIKMACKMLDEGYNVSETSYRCGFSDPNYFSKVFKKTKGMAPSDYKG